jgi:hypothetical protein
MARTVVTRKVTESKEQRAATQAKRAARVSAQRQRMATYGVYRPGTAKAAAYAANRGRRPAAAAIGRVAPSLKAKTILFKPPRLKRRGRR